MGKIVTYGVPEGTFAYLNSEGFYSLFKNGTVIPFTAPNPKLRIFVSNISYNKFGPCIYCGEKYWSHRNKSLSFPHACSSVNLINKQLDFIEAELNDGFRSANYFYQSENEK